MFEFVKLFPVEMKQNYFREATDADQCILSIGLVTN
jgi:hypothetical protein